MSSTLLFSVSWSLLVADRFVSQEFCITFVKMNGIDKNSNGKILTINYVLMKWLMLRLNRDDWPIVGLNALEKESIILARVSNQILRRRDE